MHAPFVLRADWIWAGPGRLHQGAGLLLEDGRIADFAEDAETLPSDVETVHLGSWLLMPAWVNAHAHLDLTHLRGCIAPGTEFGDWVRQLLSSRAAASAKASAEALVEAAVQEGLEFCLAGGCALVGDIASAADELAGTEVAEGHDRSVRRLTFGEFLDGGDAQRQAEQLKLLERFADFAKEPWGLSPHAPHTCSEGLLQACTGSGRALQVHWAETVDEVDYLAGRQSAFSGWLPRLDALGSGLDRLGRAGLLGPQTALVHGNHAEPGDWQRIAKSGAALVHCPGTHRFFERGATPVRSALEHGVTLGLGTDSAVSNARLDMPSEVALLLNSDPWLSAERALEFATLGGAQALGLQGSFGCLEVGRAAHLFGLSIDGSEAGAPLEHALREPERPRRMFLHGSAVRPWSPREADSASPADPRHAWAWEDVAARWSL